MQEPKLNARARYRRKYVQMEKGGCGNHLGSTIIPTTDLMELTLTSPSAECNRNTDWGQSLHDVQSVHQVSPNTPAAGNDPGLSTEGNLRWQELSPWFQPGVGLPGK